MIPNFTDDGLLPAGIHEATWEEVCARFGGPSPKRKHLIKKLENVITILKQAKCKLLYIDGSFVTAKKRPGDFDVCWLRDADVDRGALPAEIRFSPNSINGINCKKKYGGDVFHTTRQVSVSDDVNTLDTISFLEFFQRDKETHKPKGIIVIKLSP